MLISKTPLTEPKEYFNKKTQSTSFRIGSEVLKEITKEAHLREESVNTLVNQILRRFVEFDRYSKRINIIPAPKQLLVDLIYDCDDRKLKFLAERTFTTLKDVALFMHKRQDLLAVLHILELYMKVAGIATDSTIDGNKHSFVVQHDMGLKWSEFTKELLSIVFEKLANNRPDFEITESCVTATVELPDSIH